MNSIMRELPSVIDTRVTFKKLNERITKRERNGKVRKKRSKSFKART